MTLHVEGKAENGGKVLFSFDLAYAGVFRIVNVPQENLHPLVMIECPRLLFPFAREIIATSVRDGGFPPLMLDPVDFVGLYRQNMERQAAAQPGQLQASERNRADRLAGSRVSSPAENRSRSACRRAWRQRPGARRGRRRSAAARAASRAAAAACPRPPRP